MGTSIPSLARPSTIAGSAAAAASLLTVTRTSSDPAVASAATCWTVPCTSAVSVLVMDCTTTGAEEPTRTFPTLTVVDFLRSSCAIYPSLLVYNPAHPTALTCLQCINRFESRGLGTLDRQQAHQWRPAMPEQLETLSDT